MKHLTAFDLETHLIQPGLLAPPIVCGSLARSGEFPELLTKRQAMAEFKAALSTSEVICGANIAYDFGCCLAEDPSLLELAFDKYNRGEVYDVLISQSLDSIAKGLMQDGDLYDEETGERLKHPVKGTLVMRYSLEIVTWLCTGRVDAKGNDRWRLSYALLEDVPMKDWPDDARQYPLDDAVNTLEVAEYQRLHHKNQHDLPNQCRAAFAEHLSSMWGLRTDPAKVAALRERLHLEKTEKTAEFIDLGWVRPDGSKNTKAIKEAVEKAYGGSPPRTATGQVSTARDVLSDANDPVVQRFAAISKIDKMIGTYLPFVESGLEKPINLQPNVLLANGRSSYNGLIQLLPRKGGVRECFTARPGTVICSVDLSAGESSTLAQVCINTVGYSKLAEAINAGKDAHSLFAASIYSAEYEEVLAAVEAGDPVWKDRRQMTKAANFGYPGAMGAYKFAQSKRKEGLKLCLAARVAEKCGEEMIDWWKGRKYPVPACKACVEQGEKLRNAFLAMWPEVPEMFKWVNNKLHETGHLVLTKPDADEEQYEQIRGELTQFVSGRVRGELTLPSGANTLFSALLADMTKESLWAITEECYLASKKSPLYGSRVLVYAHDETILELPEEGFEMAANRQTELMLAFKPKYLPDVALRAKPAVSRFWSKDMADVYDENGVLAIWEPKPEKAESIK